MELNTQLSAVLLGSSLQFSNNLIRILDFEFPEVHFDRRHDTAALPHLKLQPKLVVVHESVPNLEGSVRDVRTHLPNAMVAVACSEVAEIRTVLDPDTSRSVSLLPLNTPIDVWLSILRLLLCGHSYAPAEQYCGQPATVRRKPDDPAEAKPGGDVCLTPRELQILPLIAQGLQNKVIAGTLDLSEHTVKLHTHNIFAKLGVSNRTAAAKWYLSRVEGGGRPEQFHGQ